MNTCFCICENKGAGQLHGDCAADQHIIFSYIDSTIPLLSKSEISSLQPSSVVVQPGLCPTWSENPKTGYLVPWLKAQMVHVGMAPRNTNYGMDLTRGTL